MNAIATQPDRPPQSLINSLTVADVLRHVQLVEHVVKEVMKEGTHYGEAFPGDKKKNLLKPGADKLAVTFQLASAYEVDERNLDNGHREYRITCRMTSAGGREVAQGVGSCSTMETKFRYRNAKPKCPKCTKETVIKTKKGYWCPPDKGGCGANPDDNAIESQQRGRVENPDIADTYNTVLKMGKKRAYVDATISATGCSDLFTQDLEDLDRGVAEDDARQVKRTFEAKVDPTTGEIKTKKPAWTPEQTAEGAQLRARAVACGQAADAAFTACWKKHAYSEPSDTIDALVGVVREQEDIQDQLNHQDQSTPDGSHK